MDLLSLENLVGIYFHIVLTINYIIVDVLGGVVNSRATVLKMIWPWVHLYY